MPAEIIFLHREKVFLDTSVYISHLNKGVYGERILALVRSSILHLHSVVFEELLAGARSAKEIRELGRLKKPFAKAGRLITPTDGDWEETGFFLNRWIRQGHLPPATVVSLTHDVLLAVSARRRGVRIVTENRRDFERIAAVKAFKLTVWP